MSTEQRISWCCSDREVKKKERSFQKKKKKKDREGEMRTPRALHAGPAGRAEASECPPMERVRITSLHCG